MIYPISLLAIAMTALAVWTSRKALEMNALAIDLASDRDDWVDAAAFWQQQAGENATKAAKWDLHLAACRRGGQTAAERQRLPKLQMMERLRGEG